MDIAPETECTAETGRHVDVLVVGAGISGIDAAYHLQQHCPGKRFAILEAKDTFGGTWTTHGSRLRISGRSGSTRTAPSRG